MLFGIHQEESSLYLFQSDAASAHVIFLFGKVRVFGAEEDGVLFVTSQGYVDEAFLRRADAMFEGILYQRDEDERCDG